MKLSIEKYLWRYHRFKTLSLRLSSAYGKCQRMDKSQGTVSVFYHKAVRGETIEISGDGSVVRDFLYVNDTVSTMLKPIGSSCADQEITFGYGSGAGIKDLLAMIGSSVGARGQQEIPAGQGL